MISIFECERESKTLFFKLNNAFHLLDPESSSTYKIAGIYAIYKNGVCHYVGQSKNLPSRLATHLCGKYKDADTVKIYFAGEIGGSYDYPFYLWSKVDQSIYLDASEACCIAELEPIENIYIPEISNEDEDWIIEPEVESALIEIDETDFTVYRDPFNIVRASKTIQSAFIYELKAIRRAQDAKS
jgi:hypothetical protein